MTEKDRDEGETAPRQGYIPRPPSKEDVDRVSGQQGLITDDWTGPAPADAPKEEDGGGPEQETTEGNPS